LIDKIGCAGWLLGLFTCVVCYLGLLVELIC
jgi:hypothetical protein